MAVPVRTDLLAQVLDDSRRMVSGLGRLLEEQRIRVEGLARGLPDPVALLRSNEQRLDDLSERLKDERPDGETLRRQKVENLAARLRSPKQLVDDATDRLTRESQAMTTAWSHFERRIHDRASQAGKPSFAGSDPAAIGYPFQSNRRVGRRSAAAVTLAMKDASNRWSRFGDLLESYSFERVMERGFAVVVDDAGNTVTTAKSLKTNDAVEMRFSDGNAHAVVTGSKATTPTKKKNPPLLKTTNVKAVCFEDGLCHSSWSGLGKQFGRHRART